MQFVDNLTQEKNIIFPSFRGDCSICFSVEWAKTLGKIWKGFPPVSLVAAWSEFRQKWTAKKKDTSFFSIKWAEKVEAKGWMACPPVLEKRLSYKNGKRFFFYSRENSEKWKAFPPFGMRGDGHHSLLLLRSSARKVDRFFHPWEICPIMDSISSRSHKKFQSDCFSSKRSFAKKGLRVLILLRRKNYSSKRSQHFLPLLQKKSAPKTDSVSFFSQTTSPEKDIRFDSTLIVRKNLAPKTGCISPPSSQVKLIKIDSVSCWIFYEKSEPIGKWQHLVLIVLKNSAQKRMSSQETSQKNSSTSCCSYARSHPEIWGSARPWPDWIIMMPMTTCPYPPDPINSTNL